MSKNTYDSDLGKAIANVAEAIAEGIKAARAKGVICGPVQNLHFKTDEWIGEGMVTTLESLTLSSVDAAPAKPAPLWKRFFMRRS